MIPKGTDKYLGKQAQAIDLSSETAGKESKELQGQSETDLGQIPGHVVAGTIPEECEVQQGHLEFGNSNSYHEIVQLYSSSEVKEQRAMGGSIPTTSESNNCLGGTPNEPFRWHQNSQKGAAELVLAGDEF